MGTAESEFKKSVKLRFLKQHELAEVKQFADLVSAVVVIVGRTHAERQNAKANLLALAAVSLLAKVAAAFKCSF